MSGELSAMVVVAPASTDISGVAVEMKLGTGEGLPDDGVVRVALPRPGKINCSWLITLRPTDLIEQAGVLSPPRLREFDQLLRLADLG
jgi:mRNA interferase MazF